MFSTLPLKDVLPKIRKEANQALALDPRNANALVVLGNADVAENHIAEAKAEYLRALKLDPSDANAHLNYGTVLPLKQAVAQELEAVQLDPDNATAQNNLSVYALDSGEYQQALAPGLSLMRLDPHSADSAFGLALTYALLHRDTEAVKAFDLAQPATELAKSLVAAGRLAYQSLVDPKLHEQALATVDALRRRTDLDSFSMFDIMQIELALDENEVALAQLPKFCASLASACIDLSVNPQYVRLRGQPRFEALVKQYDTASKPAPAATTSSAGTAPP
ncbi:MAG: tetratricopeptide repeat protein [Proteobacteria bacterium]|nr:tetratricopeptide repeat protein [Pseudomonadota bacterium]